MDGRTFIGYDPAATEAPPVLRQQVWIDLPTSRFRSVKGFVDGPMESFKVSDGLTVLEMNLQTGQSQSNALPDLGPEKQFVPEYQPGYADSQPLWGQIGTTLSLLAFPSEFAQSEGVFKPTAMEIVAGRETLVVEWTYASNDLPSWKMWLDTETAVALKLQHFGKEGSDRVQSETVVHEVIYDGLFDRFSPDGRYLLFQDDDAAGRHIFIIDLSTLEQHKLQVPNLPLDWWWLAPSWRSSNHRNFV